MIWKGAERTFHSVSSAATVTTKRSCPAERVFAPLIADCLANIECNVADTSLVDTYNLFILEAVGIWVDETRKEVRTLHHRGNGNFTVDGDTIDLRSRMVKWRHLP